MAKNISKVYLLNVPLEDDMRNTLYFVDASAQQSYFSSNIGKTYTDVSYQSETRTFRCRDQIDTVRQYNYIMWQNTAYSNKWFYAFIKEMKYVSDGFTDVVFEVDPLQTYMFDITVKPSFIEREHTNNDTAGNNTLEENVALGPFVFNGNATNFGQATVDDGYIALGVTELIEPFKSNNPLNNWLTVYGGIFSGLNYMFFNDFVSLQRTIDYYNKNKSGDLGIQTIFYVPYTFVANSSPKTHQYWLTSVTNTVTVTWIEPSIDPVSSYQTISKPSSIDSYVPRNKKLLTAPYCFFNLTNNVGSEFEYHYEDFSGNPRFDVTMTLCPSMSIKATAHNYKNGGNDQTWGEGVMGAKTPQCSWTTDYYTNWLTQNAVNIPLQGLSSAFSVVGNLATGNLLGATSTFLGSVGGVIGENYQASRVPDQINGNINSGDVSFSNNKCCFTIIPKSIKAQYARIIDDYFDMFGYKTNRVKTPNVAHRQNWWYIKTIGANIVGNVPNDEMNKIKEAYNNGLTYWKNASNFLNYSVSNGIV